MTDASPGAERAFVLGLDGVPWSLIERWSDDGSLPNFSRLRREGAAGTLRSTTPATTAPAWPSIATGVQPDKHGIYGFRRLDSGYGHSMNTSADWKAAPIWRRLTPAVVGNVPMTYPAESIDGKMVSGMMTPTPGEGFTHPPSLREEILERIPEYAIGLDWGEYVDRNEAFLDEFEALLDGRIELLRLLMDDADWRLFFFVFTAPDRLQHLVWDESVIREVYRRLDGVLGDVMEYVEAHDATLYVVSDHGFGPISKVANANVVLAEEGYLARAEDSGTRGVLSALGVTKANVRGWLEQTGISEEEATSYLPQAFVDMVALQVPGEHALYDVDFGATRAFVHGKGELYVNDTERFDEETVPPESVDALKHELAAAFESYEDPDTGSCPFDVHDGDDLFPTDRDSPDLVVTTVEGYDCLTLLTDDVFETPAGKAAGHLPEGIFLAWGPDVAPGVTPRDASVFDVAPTILHGAGRPVPERTDGRVLREIFEGGSTPARATVERTSVEGADSTPRVGSDGSDGSVKERLRGLGYLD